MLLTAGRSRQGLVKRENAFNPSVAFLAGASPRSFPPQDSVAQDSLGMVARWRDTLFYEEEPKRVDLAVKPFGKLSCGIVSFDVFGD